MIKNENPCPDQPSKQKGQEVSIPDGIVCAQNKKNVSRWNTVEIKLVHLKDGKTQLYLIGDDHPHALWTHVYQNFEMTSAHANEIRKRLIPGIHFIEVSKSEMEQFDPCTNVTLMVGFNSPVYYFLTEEGFNRIVIEVDTSRMKNPDAVSRINKRRDEIAHIYTLYQRGELVIPADIKQISSKRDLSTDLSKQVARAVNENIVPLYRERGENPHLAFSRENRAINEITAGKHEPDMKNKLNSTGLDVQITTKVADITCMKAKILNDTVRWEHVKDVVDTIHPDRLSQNLKISEREIALLSRKCDEKQTTLGSYIQERLS
jgi:hypothetical protein